MKFTSSMISLIVISLFSFFVSCEVVPVETNETVSKETLRLVNQLRKEGCMCGNTYYEPVGALVWNDLLEQTAMGHSKDMASKNYFGHTDKSGFNAEVRLEENGYPWRSYGENIYQNTDPNHTANDAVKAWKDSPGHCVNMMKPHFTEMGVAQYQGYWTQLLGSR